MRNVTTEALEIKQLAHQFAESELRPHVEKWDHDGAVDEGVRAQLAELGFFGMLVPESFGGMEFDLPTYVAAIEEIAWGEPSVALTLVQSSSVAALIAAHGTDAQKQAWLEKIAQGDVVCCVARAEETPVVLKDNRLTGRKRWVTNGRAADLALVTAQGNAYLVATDSDGYKAGERATTLGLRPVEIVAVDFDVTVTDDARLNIASTLNAAALLGVAALSVGIAQAALDHALGYANIREQFKTKLRDFEGVQFKLADMAMRTDAARQLTQSAAQDGTLTRARMAKVFASETAMWVTTQAVQIFGGYGYMRDYPVEKLMRDAKATELLEGPNEIQRVKIAQELYDQEG